jgi:hypothetical protein
MQRDRDALDPLLFFYSEKLATQCSCRLDFTAKGRRWWQEPSTIGRSAAVRSGGRPIPSVRSDAVRSLFGQMC